MSCPWPFITCHRDTLLPNMSLLQNPDVPHTGSRRRALDGFATILVPLPSQPPSLLSLWMMLSLLMLMIRWSGPPT